MTHYRKASCDVVPITDHDPIIEAAVQALQDWFNDTERCHGAAKDVVTAVTPLIEADAYVAVVKLKSIIEADALEEAAKVADLYTKKEMPWPSHETAHVIASRIRALKEHP